MILKDGRALIGSTGNANLPTEGGILCDANLDGRIDGADLASWQVGYDPLGADGPHTIADGDFNGDGKVDGTDLAAWQRNYYPVDLVHGSGAAYVFDELTIERIEDVEAIPEPATISLLGLAVLPLLSCRKRYAVCFSGRAGRPASDPSRSC